MGSGEFIIKLASVSLIFSTFLLGSVQPVTAYEYNDYLNPQEYLTRCFQSLGNIRLSFLDSRRGVVTNMNQAVSLCERLIEAPKINPVSGTIYSSDPMISSRDAQAVVRRFHQYHEYFFENVTYEKIMEDLGKARMLYDTALPAAYFTYAMFNPNPNYKLAVTETSALKIIRTGSSQNRYGSIVNTSTNETFLEAYDSSNSNGNPKMIESVERGIFSGIKKVTTTPSSQLFASPSDNHQPINNHETLGGGFLGTPNFILLNIGQNDKIDNNGSMVLPRRISKNIMDVAFCRDGPYLKLSHVPSTDVQTTNNPPSFRANAECNRCHSLMDPLAYAYRNVQYRLSARESAIPEPAGFSRCRYHNMNGDCVTSTSETAFLPIVYRVKDNQMIAGQILNSFNWIVPSSGYPNFHRSKNFKGRFRYTSAFGTAPVNHEFNVLADSQTSGNQQLSELGNLIANSNDYYLCGALKYSKMLFGIPIKVNVDSLPNLQSNASTQQVNVWNQLKETVLSNNPSLAFNSQNPNPKQLIKNLIRSPEFKSRAFGRRPPIQSISISGIQPTYGPSGVSTLINLFGSNFGPGTTVQIGGQACTNVNVQSSGHLTCLTPANQWIGPVSVIVNRNNYSDVLPDGYKYISQLTWNGGIKNVFQSCTGCHGGSSPQNGLNFSTYNGFITTTNPLTSAQCNESSPHSILSISNGVINVQNSILVQKVGPNGNMNVHLNDDANNTKFNLIQQWLQLGAPEN